jgi:peptide/nickel transport system substrate-binding protein
MPDPAANFQLMKADLEAVGITVVPKTAPWNPDYLDAVDGGSAAIYLLGWTGDFGDPDNFIGTFFQAPLKQWGFDNPELFAALDAAEAEPDQAKRETLYQDINRQIMDFLPGLPYAHTEPTLAFEDNVEGFVPSPVTNEDFSTVSFS